MDRDFPRSGVTRSVVRIREGESRMLRACENATSLEVNGELRREEAVGAYRADMLQASGGGGKNLYVIDIPNTAELGVADDDGVLVLVQESKNNLLRKERVQRGALTTLRQSGPLGDGPGESPRGSGAKADVAEEV